MAASRARPLNPNSESLGDAIVVEKSTSDWRRCLVNLCEPRLGEVKYPTALDRVIPDAGDGIPADGAVAPIPVDQSAFSPARRRAILVTRIHAKNVAGTATFLAPSSERKLPWLMNDAALMTACAIAPRTASLAVHTDRQRCRRTSAA
jgi:hypothetical protein